jgi:glutaminyl-tRNA synthetase
VTHSICTLEFEVHRPLYDWLIAHLPVPHVPHQYEFARLNLTHTVLSKRVLLRLVTEGHVRGWDDPRMPTISGLRRRGYPAEGIRNFATEVGVSKADSVHEIELLEHNVRDVLNRTAPRRFGVLDPLKVVIENWPRAGRVARRREQPGGPVGRHAKVEFGRELWIERDDFMEEPAPKFFRLAPGREVRLRNAYFITCDSVVKDESGPRGRAAVHVRPGDARRRRPGRPRPKATLHWVSAAHAVPAEVRLYDHLFSRRSRRRGRAVRRPQPGVGDDRVGRDAGAVAGVNADRRDGPVRAPRLLQRPTRTRERTRSSSTER